MPLLEVRDLTVYYGSVRALNSVTFKVEAGEIVSMIGPNGAGKSTTLKAVCGLIQLKGQNSGQIIFNNEHIESNQPYELVKKGISLVPEGRRIFGSMTVLENLEMGGFTLDNKKKIENRLNMIFNLFPRLAERRQQRAETLSSGEQQILAIARALMLEPRLLLIDEPSIGLSPNFVKLVFEKLKEINTSGTSILLVEQNAKVALANSNRCYVFNIGGIEMEGVSDTLLKELKAKKWLLGM